MKPGGSPFQQRPYYDKPGGIHNHMGASVTT
jgi:hypothetical protein